MLNAPNLPTSFRRGKFTLAPGLFALLTSLAQAAPPELQSLQNAYKKKVAEVAAPAAETFATDLKKIASSQAATGNYKEAAATKFKADSTLAFLDSLKVSSSSSVVLPLAGATHIGQVSYSAETNTLGRFSTENARASWELRQIIPGTYDVSLTFSVNHKVEVNPEDSSETEDAGGTFQIREDTKLQRVNSGANSITHEVVSTGGWDAFRTEIIGSITLASTPATIVLEALKPEPQGLMQLLEIRLIPQRDRASERTPVSSSAEKLASLKRDHEARMIPILSPITTDHIAEITSIKNAAAAAGADNAITKADELLLGYETSISSEKTSAQRHSHPPITLNAVDDLKVQLAGTTTPDSSRDYLTKLGPAGEGAVTWRLPPGRPGTQFYEASIRQRRTKSSGGRLILTAGENEISYYLARPDQDQLKNPAFQDTPLGTIEIPTSAVAIQLRVQSLDPDSEFLTDLASLTLQPLDSDPAAKEAITKQEQKLQKLLEKAEEGWTIIKGATYSPSDADRASEFDIKTASGETMKLVLDGVNAPPPDYEKSGKSVEELRSIFSRSQTVLERVGRKAIKLVDDTLASGNCIIYTRERSHQGRILATILTPEGSTLAVDLASEGLALDTHLYTNHPYPKAIGADMRPEVYSRWIKASIKSARRGNKGIWKQ